MLRRILPILILLIYLLTSALPIAADGPAALDWLRSKQAQDGGFAGDFDDASSLGATVEGIFAIVAQAEDPNTWTQDGNTPVAFLQSQAAELALPGDIAKATLAAIAAGANPRDFGGLDLISALAAQYDADSGLYGGTELGNVFGQSLTILALTASGQSTPHGALGWLLSSQIEDGSWSWNGETAPGGGDSNSTAIAVQALLAAGYSGEAITNAVAYFAASQNDDGGFTYQKPSDFGTDTDANSTAYVIQALLAAGEDLSAWAKEGITPIDALLVLQKENGAFQWQAAFPDDNFLATSQAIPALVGLSFAQVAGTIEAGPPTQLPQSGGVEGDAEGTGTIWSILIGLALISAGWATYRRQTEAS